MLTYVALISQGIIISIITCCKEGASTKIYWQEHKGNVFKLYTNYKCAQRMKLPLKQSIILGLLNKRDLTKPIMILQYSILEKLVTTIRCLFTLICILVSHP